jgi:hypothetical protein
MNNSERLCNIQDELVYLNDKVNHETRFIKSILHKIIEELRQIQEKKTLIEADK